MAGVDRAVACRPGGIWFPFPLLNSHLPRTCFQHGTHTPSTTSYLAALLNHHVDFLMDLSKMSFMTIFILYSTAVTETSLSIIVWPATTPSTDIAPLYWPPKTEGAESNFSIKGVFFSWPCTDCRKHYLRHSRFMEHAWRCRQLMFSLLVGEDTAHSAIYHHKKQYSSQCTTFCKFVFCCTASRRFIWSRTKNSLSILWRIVSFGLIYRHLCTIPNSLHHFRTVSGTTPSACKTRHPIPCC